MIIFRYLTREIFAALGAITLVLLLIFLSNQFVRYLNQAAAGKFASTVLLHLMAIEVPHLLATLLPLGLFLGIVIAYSRLYSDNEMTVLAMSGLSRTKLTLLTLPIASFIALVVGLLSLWINPQLLTYRDQLLMQTGTALELQTTLPGRFRQANGGREIFYVESLSPDHKSMQNVFLAQLPNTSSPNPSPIPNWVISIASTGYQAIDPKTGAQFFITHNGRRYQGAPGSNDFEIIRYQASNILIKNQVADLTDQQETFPTKNLFQTTTDKAKRAALLSELDWRLSMPLSAFLLTFLGILLSRVKPRQGRYAMMLPAILIYATYANLLLVGRNWVMRQHIPPLLGLWWIHTLLLIVVLLIWAHQTGWRTTINNLLTLFKKATPVYENR